MSRSVLAVVASLVLASSLLAGGAVATPGGPPGTAGGQSEASGAASVTFANQTTGGTTVTVDSVTLPDGGFVAIHDSRLTDGHPLASVVGVSGYLSAGTHENVTVRLYSPITKDATLIAMPHRDTNGDRAYEFVSSNGQTDGPYTAGGGPVTDAAAVHAGATVAVSDQQTDGSSVVLDRVELARGGFVAIHDARLQEGKPKASVVGNTSYLGPGVHRNVRVPLSTNVSAAQTLIAMPHEDTNDDEAFEFVTGSADAPYTAEGSPVTAAATVTPASTARVGFADQVSGGHRVGVRSAFLPDGGFLAIHDSRLAQGKPKASVVGSSDYLAPGLHRNVSVTLDSPITDDQSLVAMAHRDTNGNESFEFVNGSADAPYTADDGPVTDAGNVTVAASLEYPVQRSGGHSVVVPTVDLSAGGFVVVHSPLLATGAPVESVLGHSAYLPPGVHHDVTVPLSRPVNATQSVTAMAHRDTNGNEQYDFGSAKGVDAPYTAGGTPVVATAPTIVTAAVSFPNQTVDGGTVTLDSVTLDHGGFVAIHDARLTEGDALASVIGSSSYLSAGSHEDVTVHLETDLVADQTLIAMPHRDTDGDQQYDFVSSDGSTDGPYLGSGGPVVNAAQVSVPETSSTTTTTTSTTTTTATSMPSSTTPTSTPGFTPLGAVLALVAGAVLWLARRRTEK